MSQTNFLRKTAGFTLLEILVAMFIFTIVAVIMTRALHTIFENQGRTEKHAAQLAELQLASIFLQRDFEQAIDRPILNAQGNNEIALVGTADHISFTHGGLSNPSGTLLRSTLQRTNYFLEKDNLTRAAFEVLDQVSTSEATQRLLLHNVSHLHFDYLDDQGHYNDRWPPANKPKATALPSAVKVSFFIAHWGQFTQVYIIPGKSFGAQTT